MNIGIVVIATNKYIEFLNPLVESINNKFLKNHNVSIFCFTDNVNYITYDNVTIIYQKHLYWPFITLKRYEIMYKNKDFFNSLDYIFYIDADMIINDIIGDDFLPVDKDLLCVVHPFYRRDSLQSFETNVKSTAYVDKSVHHVYYCGAVQGGKKDAYLNVCKELSDNIIKDLKNDIIAMWHDESHWNKYLIENPNSYKELDCDYCYPVDLPYGYTDTWYPTYKNKITAIWIKSDDMK